MHARGVGVRRGTPRGRRVRRAVAAGAIAGATFGLVATPVTATPAPLTRCLVGTWRTTEWTDELHGRGVPIALDGGAAILRTIDADGSATVDYQRAGPLLGVGSTGLVSVQFSGVETDHVASHRGVESTTVVVPAVAQVTLGDQPSTTESTAPFEGGTRTYRCTTTTLVERVASAHRVVSWTRVRP